MTRTAILGRGRVGHALTAALRHAGLEATLLPGTSAAVGAADVVFLTVPDDAIAGVVARILPGLRSGQVVAHTSGRHGIGVLAPVRAAGAFALAFHPAMTFNGDTELAGCTVGLTADPEALPLAEALCGALGTTPVWVAEQDRDLYHAGLVHGANHLVTLIAQAREMLAAAGVSDPSAVLGPLVHAALDGALERGAEATTGPVVRGDVGTVAAHVAAIDAAVPQVAGTYAALAAATARSAAADGRLAPSRAQQVLETVAERSMAR